MIYLSNIQLNNTHYVYLILQISENFTLYVYLLNKLDYRF